MRRAARAAALLLVLLVVVAGVLLTPWGWRLIGDDQTQIALTRGEHRLLASAGLPLPGQPDLARFDERLKSAGLAAGAPVFVRIFKREFELELWMQRDGAFRLFATYPICTWSGGLGPKLAEGDGQSPEGVYTVDKNALNPNSKYFRSFNLGYPNAYDASLGRTGSFIMVHGACASIGCFAMTDAQIGEIWRLVTAALDAGQKRFQVQVLPFRPTPENFARAKAHPAIGFWRALKRGSDMFDASLTPPRVAVCNGAYVFAPAPPGSVGDADTEARCPPAGAT